MPEVALTPVDEIPTTLNGRFNESDALFAAAIAWAQSLLYPAFGRRWPRSPIPDTRIRGLYNLGEVQIAVRSLRGSP